MSQGSLVLLTGASGTVGRPLLAALAEIPSIDNIVALGHVEPVTASGPRLRVITGDIEKDGNLGLDPSDAEALASRVTGIVHAAANTRFDAPAAEARATNVDGTHHVLEFARRCPRLDRLVALSTTHVAGRRTGVILEDDLEHDAGFVNTYEAAKYEAERDVRAASDLPIAVARISTITGDAGSGALGRKAAIHQAVRLMYAGLAPMVPGREDSPVDVVALDYAVRAVACLATESFEAGVTWHVCAGEDTVPFGELIDLTMRTFVEHRPAWRRRAIERPALVDLPTFELFCRSVDEVGDAALRASTGIIARFAPQLAFPKTFDDRRCRVVLEDELGKLGVEKTPAQPETPRVPGHNVLQLAAELEAMHTASTDDAGRKLREAFYLLQDVTHLVTVFKSALVGPPPDMLSSWIEVILHRCSLFPSIKVPR